MLESGDISMSKTDGIPGVLMSGRKIDLQQACMIFNTVALHTVEEKICTVYYECIKIGATLPIPGISEGFLEKDS